MRELLIAETAMIDIQNQKDDRNIDIQKVGVKGIKYPIVVLDRANGTQHVNATINIYVALPHRFKGTHMSRFVEILNEFRGQINIKTFHKILQEVKDKLHAESAHMEIEFPYFVEKTAPVSGAKVSWNTRARSADKTASARKIFSWEWSYRSLLYAPVLRKSAILALITREVW